MHTYIHTYIHTTYIKCHLFVHPPYGMVSRMYNTKITWYMCWSMRLWRKKSFKNFEEIIASCEIIGEGVCCFVLELNLWCKVCFLVFPFQRVDSVKCKLLFELAHNASKEEKDVEEVRCPLCKCLVTDLEHQTTAETLTRKVKWQHPSSQARLLYVRM